MVKPTTIALIAISALLASSAYHLFTLSPSYSEFSEEEIVLRKEFIQWMKEFKKQYSTPSEQEHRF